MIAISACTATPTGSNNTIPENVTPIQAKEKCSSSVINVTSISGDVQGATRNYSVTVGYTVGDQPLYNFSFTIQDKFGLVGNAKSDVFTRNNPMRTGATYTFQITLPISVRSDRLSFVKARAVCLETELVQTESRY